VLRRLLALSLAGVVALTATGCADDVSPAVRVGDARLSNDDFLAEIDEWMGNPVAVDPSTLTTAAPGAHPGELVRRLLAQRIDFMLHREKFDDLGLELDDDLRQQALTVLFGDPAAAEESYAGFSDAFADDFTDDVARQIAVQEELGDEGYAEWNEGAYAGTDIEVHSRYGRWDPASRSVTPPPAAETSG
jgi:hypothetical protein